ESNYVEFLDQYSFIGLTERMQESADKLADIMQKRKKKMPHLNTSPRTSGVQISDEVKTLFRERNFLDYALYEYAEKKFFRN
ncbi:MAG: hypothetical protein AAF901_03655, partial [Bacteroidota bacterium]